MTAHVRTFDRIRWQNETHLKGGMGGWWVMTLLRISSAFMQVNPKGPWRLWMAYKMMPKL